METKVCTTCNLAKPLSLFYKSGKIRVDGSIIYKRQCGNCSRDYTKQWRKDNPIKAKQTDRKNKLKGLYGITEADLVDMIEAQDNKCLVCTDELIGIHIDHCHREGNVRGLLCRLCNLGLGHFRDNTESLKRAITYLEYNNE